MKHSSLEIGSGARVMARALRSIRKKRTMTAADVAGAMGMARRTYEEFEAGRGPLTHERIFAFADATDCDPFALILSPHLGVPDIAIDCADTKLCMIIMMHFREFAAAEGGDIVYLEPPHVIGGFERVFSELSAKLADREAFIQKWLDQRTGSIGLDTLKLRGVKRRAAKS